MALEIKYPCRGETHIVELWASDDPDVYRDVELKLPHHDIEEEIIAVELGDEPSECLRLKELADQGFYHLLGDPVFLGRFLEALKEPGAGPEDLNPLYFNMSHLAQRIADFFYWELSGEENSVSSEDPASLLKAIDAVMPEILKTYEFQNRIAELAEQAYNEEYWDFIKELNDIAKNQFYDLEINEQSVETSGPGYSKTIFNMSFNIGDAELDSWGVCVAGYYEIPDMEWVTDYCDHENANYQTEEFLGALSESTEWKDYVDVDEPSWVPSPDGEGGYSIWVDGQLEELFEDEGYARDYFDIMCSSANFQADEHGSSWDIELKELSESEDEELDPEDEESWVTIDSCE